MATADGVIVKISLEEDVRRRTVTEIRNLAQLKELAIDLFVAEIPDQFCLLFVGEEGDRFLVGSEKALQAALEFAATKTCLIDHQKLSILRLFIEPADSPLIPPLREEFVDPAPDPPSEEPTQPPEQNRKSISDPFLPGEKEPELEQLEFGSDFEEVGDEQVLESEILSSPLRMGSHDSVPLLLDGSHPGDHASNHPDDLPDNSLESSQGQEEEDDSSTTVAKADSEESGGGPSGGGNDWTVDQGNYQSVAGAVVGVLKTAFFVPTYFCSSCTSSADPEPSRNPPSSSSSSEPKKG